MTGQFTWLDAAGQVEAGRALFSSDLTFQVWAYTVSHCQLLLRAWREGDAGGTRTDVLFRGVAVLRISAQLPELVLHQATPDERRRILAGAGVSGGSLRVIVVHARLGTVAGYVVAQEVGWLEDTEDKRDPSALAAAVPLGPDPLLPADARTCQPAEPERQWLASLAEREPGAELFRSENAF